jgi:ribonuclease VapC
VITVDASAVLAIFLKEPDADLYASRLAWERDAVISAVSYWEVLAKAWMTRGQDGEAVIDDLLRDLGVRIVPVDAATARDAAAAFYRYRGRPARLNLGDTFAYALAMREGDGLLFKGNDFPSTDIKSALP